MPKKNHKTIYSKPSSIAHPSLGPSQGSSSGNGRLSKAASPAPSSVNDLISHLRQTQIRDDLPKPATRVPTTLHPSLRNLLDVPEVLPPIPRPGTPYAGPTRTRRIPGPPPPRSWLAASRHAPRDELKKNMVAFKAAGRRIQHQANSLPGGAFPLDRSLQHFVLKSMARNWQTHLEYDNIYLASIPTHLKEMLLSYIAIYAEEGSLTTLRRLFPHPAGGDPDDSTDDVSEVTRLDLTNALGPRLSMKQLTKELVHSLPAGGPATSTAGKPTLPRGDNRGTDASAILPGSWDESASDGGSENDLGSYSIPATLEGPASLRFQNLSHLALGISPITRSSSKAASWQALLSLAPHISTLSSLSLAYWPPPTLTPNAAATFATIKNPVSSSLPGISYGGSDIYTAYDGDWAEAAGILRRLSRSLYCLKWLDLTGCGAWIGSLMWGGGVGGDPGAEWNGAWRGVEHVVLSVGWAPGGLDDESAEKLQDLQSSEQRLESQSSEEPETPFAMMSTTDAMTNNAIAQDWDVEAERRRYYKQGELNRFNEEWNTAQRVANYLREIRRAKSGKWIEFEFSEAAPRVIT